MMPVLWKFHFYNETNALYGKNVISLEIEWYYMYSYMLS